MKMKKALALAMVATMATVAFAGCGDNSNAGSGSNNTTDNTVSQTTETKTDAKKTEAPAEGNAEVEEVSLKVWAPEEDIEITQGMMETFEAAHPEYKITWDLTVVGIDESVDQIETDADTAADIFLAPSGSIPQLVEEGLIMPITVNASEINSLYGEGALSACSKDGELYGLPMSPNCFFMYYNKALLNEDEIGSLEKIMAKDLGDGVANFSCTIANSWYIESFFYAAGATLFGPNGDDATSCTWNGEKGVAAVEYLLDLTSNPKYVEDKDGIAGSMFKEGNLAAVCTGTWSQEGFEEALGEDLGAVALPTININGSDARLSNFADYKCYVVKSNTAAPRAAQLFAEWIDNADNQLIRFQKNHTTPTALSLQDNADVAADVGTAALLSQTQYATPQPAISQMGEYWGAAATLGEAIINGEVNSGNAQQYLDITVTSILSNLTE